MSDQDSKLPLAERISEVEKRTQGKLLDLSYRANQVELDGSAWLITPASPTAPSYAVFLHGGGQDRSASIEEAFLLADDGITSLLVDLPQARMFPRFGDPEEEVKALQRTVISVIRGIDCLTGLCKLDERRGAIVGFSFGAWIGALIAASDSRLNAAILTAIAPRMSEFWRTNTNPEVAHIRAGLSQQTLARFEELSRSLDAVQHLGRRVDLRLLFQFAAGDEFITEQQTREFLPYAEGKNSLRMYQSHSHYGLFLDPDARSERIAWLREQLGNSNCNSSK